MFISEIPIHASTDGKTGTTTYAYSSYLTGKLLGFTYLPTTNFEYTTGNSVGDYEMQLTRKSTGANQDDVLIKKFKVMPSRRHFSVSMHCRGSSGAPLTTDYRVPWIPLADEQLRVIVQPCTAATAADAKILLLIDGPPTLAYVAT